MAKHKYHCTYCNFKTTDLDEYGTHEQACLEAREEDEKNLLGDEYYDLETLREDARIPEELVDLLRTIILELRSK